MFSVLKARRAGIYTESKLHNEHQFYGAFSSDLKSASSEVLIESPFVTLRRSTEISSLISKAVARGVTIKIYTRNPIHHEGLLVDEARRGISILREAGAIVYECNDLRHRKIAIVDNSILWEGSLNMLSQNGSKEIMRRSVSDDLCSQMKQFLGVR